MRQTTILLMAVVAIAAANPTMQYFLSEIQAAPDSLERVELHMYLGLMPYPVDLSGCQIVTTAGTATIDSGVVLQDSNDFVVISRENTTGTFSLCDSADTVFLVGLGDVEPYAYGSYGWTPPALMSAAIFAHWEGVWPYEYLARCWYLDSTPTLGAPNDDCYGGIAGRVLDRFGQPLENCWVRLQNAHGNGGVACDSTGRYVMSPLGPGTYEVSARSDSTYLPAYYAESVSIGANGWMDSINMTMYPAGVSEGPLATVPTVFLRQRGHSLVLTAERPGTVLVSIYDNLGRVRMSEKVVLVSGSNDLVLPSLQSGIYFASCRFGERTLKTKFVLY
jgi:hypothetical protein